MDISNQRFGRGLRNVETNPPPSPRGYPYKFDFRVDHEVKKCYLDFKM